MNQKGRDTSHQKDSIRGNWHELPVPSENGFKIAVIIAKVGMPCKTCTSWNGKRATIKILNTE